MTIYDLEDRTRRFALEVRILTRSIQKIPSSADDLKQLVRSSGSVAANFIEANEALSRRDYIYRVKVCRKEAKESSLWLVLLGTGLPPLLEEKRRVLLKESQELVLIFASILRNCGAIK